MARPKLKDETKRKTNITIRLDEQDRKHLNELAKELNLSLAATIRLLIFTGGKISIRNIRDKKQ